MSTCNATKHLTGDAFAAKIAQGNLIPRTVYYVTEDSGIVYLYYVRDDYSVFNITGDPDLTRFLKFPNICSLPEVITSPPYFSANNDFRDLPSICSL